MNFTIYKNIQGSLLKIAIVAMAMLGVQQTTFAQHYWVGGSGNWSDAANHWATSSGGTMFHANPPTSDDDVYFDANSFTESGQLVTLDEDVQYCKDISWDGVLNFPSFQMDFWYDLLVYGSVEFSADATYNMSEVRLLGEGTDHTITSNGAYLGNNSSLRFFGDGEYTLTDNVQCSDLYLLSGTLNSAGHDLFIDFAVRLESDNDKTFNMGSSEVHCGQWRTIGNNTNVNAGTSNIITSAMYADESGTGPFTYHNLTFTDNGAILYGGGIFNVIDANATAGNSVRFEAGTTVTCDDFLLSTDKLNPVEMYVGLGEGHVTMEKSTGSIDLVYAIMQDIHATGGASFNVNPGVDNGNNVGWNITEVVPIDYYWIDNGGDWEDLDHWSTNSGGSADQTEMPSQFDNVYFDANSFSNDGQTVDVNGPIKMLSMYWEDITNEPYFNAPYGNGLTIYGDMIFSDDMDKYVHGITFNCATEANLYFGENGNVGYPYFYGTGTYNLQSDVYCSTFSLNAGELFSNGHNIYCSIDFKNFTSTPTVMNLANSEVHCRDFNLSVNNFTLNAGTSKIHVRRDFFGNEMNYYHVVLEEEGSIYDSNTYNILEFAPGVLCQLEAGTTQTVNGEIFINGNSLSPINISSTEDGVQATLHKNSGPVNAAFVSLKDNNATGGATFTAIQSVDNGNNTGWNITEIVPQDFYWVGGSGNWSDAENHWATTSGGSTFFNFVPGALDNVFFDANSFDADGGEVMIDIESINLKNLNCTGVTNNPSIFGSDKTMNVYGDLIISENMNVDVQNFNFFGEDTHVIDPGYDGFPGTSSYFYFNSGGTWNLSDSLTVRELNLEGGTFNSNGNGLHVDFATYFSGTNTKTLNVESSNYYTRSMSWLDYTGDNLSIEAADSYIICSSSFSPNSLEPNNNSFTFHDMNINSFGFWDQASINNDLTLNTLSIAPGKTLEILNTSVVTVNQLVAQGTADDFIVIRGSSDGIQATISMESGTVDGQYLELQDISGTGGATFYANNSINAGNVSGWIFTGVAQTINFPSIDDVMEDIGTFNLSATASSELTVSYEIVSGPATIDGNTVTITGAGPIEIQATQDGDTEFNPAPSVTNEFCSLPLQPTITGDVGSSAVLTSSSDEGNQWYFEGDDISGANGQMYEGFEVGTYSVQVDIDGCVSSFSEDFVVLELSIEDLELLTGISVYPNPTVHVLTVNLNGIQTVDYQLYSMTGSMVQRGTLSSVNSIIEMNAMEAGMYILDMQLDQTHYQVRIVKK